VIRLRDHLTRRAVELLDIVADSAEAEGRIADAVGALDRINELDPYNESVLERGRDLLHSVGREQQAEEWEERLRRLDLQ
jgi:DNA-binding SARP family transcriptional activator